MLLVVLCLVSSVESMITTLDPGMKEIISEQKLVLSLYTGTWSVCLVMIVKLGLNYVSHCKLHFMSATTRGKPTLCQYIICSVDALMKTVESIIMCKTNYNCYI